jgi:hypothetical protein
MPLPQPDYQAFLDSFNPDDYELIDAENSDGKEDIDSETLSEQKELWKAKTERYKSDTLDRKWLAEWATTVVSIWLFLVILIVMANESKFHLSDTVLSVLLGTTTFNILGLTYIVLKGHFEQNAE